MIYNSNGLTIDTLKELVATLQAEYRAIYGQAIILDDNTPDGQRINLHAKAINDLQSALAYFYNSLNPDVAEGVALENLCALNGITRRAPTKTQLDVSVSASAQTEIYAGYTIEDSAKQKWVRADAITVPSGSTVITFVAENFGAVVPALPLAQSDIVPTITALTGGAYSLGTNEQTDVELRAERKLSLQAGSRSTIGAMTAALYAVEGVTQAKVYENKTGVAVGVMPAHSVWAVVEGGDAVDITKAIAISKTAGTAEYGDITGTWTETLSNGKYHIHTVKFSRPATLQVFVRLNAAGVVIDQVKIKASIERILQVGEALDIYTLYAVDGIAGNCRLSNMEASTDGTTWTDGAITPAQGARLQILNANITITEL